MKNEQYKIRLLMVDDEEEFLASTAPALERRNIEVTTALSGIKALEILQKKSFDVLLLDVKMPDMDGIEVFQSVKREYPNLPVIILTGHGTISQAFQSVKEGVVDYIAKPCDIDDLVGKLQRAVEKHQIEWKTGETVQPGISETLPIQVLIVDDEVELLDSLQKVLQRRNMRVITTSKGDEVLSLLRENPIDVVVLDVKLPGLDGIEILSLIKKEMPMLEVVLLTGHPQVETALQGMKKGAFEYVVKPPDSEELTDIIRRAFAKRQKNVLQEQQKTIDEVLNRYIE